MHYFLRNHGINVKIHNFFIGLCVLSRTTVQQKCSVAFPHSWLGTIEGFDCPYYQSGAGLVQPRCCLALRRISLMIRNIKFCYDWFLVTRIESLNITPVWRDSSCSGNNCIKYATGKCRCQSRRTKQCWSSFLTIMALIFSNRCPQAWQ